MAKEYRPVDRGQQFLLPPDMGDWLPGDHLAWFVIDTVAQLDTSALHARSRRGGVGRQGYDPDMLLALLIYAYALKERSSRQIERLCGTDVAFRVICAQDPPDHTTLARFRQAHEAAIADLFTQVLVLCARAGLGRFGRVALDGTKIAANASPGANRTREHLRRLAAETLAQAEATDAAEDAEFGPDRRGDQMPAQWRDRSGRRERIKAALADLDAEAARDEEQARSAEDLAQYVSGLADPVAPPRGRTPKEADQVAAAEARLARERARAAQRDAARAAKEAAAAARGHKLPGTAPKPVEQRALVRRAAAALVKATAEAQTEAQTEAQAGRAAGQGSASDAPPPQRQRNLTDPESRLMPIRGGWVQGYNAQITVSDDHLILATAITQNTGDVAEFDPMVRATGRALRDVRRRARRPDARIGRMLADAGYLSAANLTAPGPDRLIAAGTRRDTEKAAREQPDNDASAEPDNPIEAMRERLRTPQGLADYRHRGATVEQINSTLKEHLGLRRFSRRGLTAVTAELQFTAMTANLLKLHRASSSTA